MSFFLISLLRSRNFTNRLVILSTLAPNHFLCGDGNPVCSGHGTVFFCTETPSKLRGMEGWQSHMEQGPLGQMEVMKAASPSHGGDKSSIYEPLPNFTALSSPNRHLWVKYCLTKLGLPNQTCVEGQEGRFRALLEADKRQVCVEERGQTHKSR